MDNALVVKQLSKVYSNTASSPFRGLRMDLRKIRGLSFLLFTGFEYNIWVRGVKRGKSSSSSVFTQAGSSRSA